MAKINKYKFDDYQYVERTWGWERWLHNSDKYCGKILFIRKGCKNSLQFHLNKTESIFLDSGKVRMRLVDTETGEEYFHELEPGEMVHLEPGQIHQIIGLEDSFIKEFSTRHEENDTLRVEPRNK